MCHDCWVEAGSPADWNDAVAEAVDLVDELYAQDDAAGGGPLHCELDDWNVDITGPFEPYGSPGNWSPETWQLSLRIAELLSGMTVDERYATLAYHEKFLPRPEGTKP